MKKKLIQRYINNFRRRLAGNLLPGIGMTCKVYPAEEGGAVIVFLLGKDFENIDLYNQKSSTLGRALKNVPQSAFGGHIENLRFSGTGTILEPGKVIFIKDNQHQEWTDRAAKKDVEAVFSSERRRAV